MNTRSKCYSNHGWDKMLGGRHTSRHIWSSRWKLFVSDSKFGQLQNLSPFRILSATEAATRASSFQRARILSLVQGIQEQSSLPLVKVFKLKIPVSALWMSS